MSRFERFGLGRVALAGLLAWLLLAAHLVLFALEVLALGVVILYGWRWLGATLRRRLERPSSRVFRGRP